MGEEIGRSSPVPQGRGGGGGGGAGSNRKANLAAYETAKARIFGTDTATQGSTPTSSRRNRKEQRGGDGEEPRSGRRRGPRRGNGGGQEKQGERQGGNKPRRQNRGTKAFSLVSAENHCPAYDFDDEAGAPEES